MSGRRRKPLSEAALIGWLVALGLVALLALGVGVTIYQSS